MKKLFSIILALHLAFCSLAFIIHHTTLSPWIHWGNTRSTMETVPSVRSANAARSLLSITVQEIDITASSPSPNITNASPFSMASARRATPQDFEQLRCLAVKRELSFLVTSCRIIPCQPSSTGLGWRTGQGIS